MQFQQINSDVTGQIDPNYIAYTDDSGLVWMVPEGHRFWDLYQQWLAQGNTPLPAA